MKIVFFSFYFPPDLSAGSFRSSALCSSLKNKLNFDDELHVITSHPNRYKTHLKKADDVEINGKINIHRIKVPSHSGSMFSQMLTFIVFAYHAVRLCRKLKPDFLIGTSSRLMTALLTFFCSRIQNIKFYIDIRDIFSETIADIFSLKNKILGFFIGKVFFFFEKKVLESASGVNVVSEGFPEYFENLGIDTSKWSFFSNGIDQEFQNITLPQNNVKKKIKTILYAGNIGGGQGMEKIIPDILKGLDSHYHFLIIGDGSALEKLKGSIPNSKVSNIEFLFPVDRSKLVKYYLEADILFLHLNNIPAFKRVLPSKIFEYSVFGKPIVAGVSGFPKKFLEKNILNAYIFEPGDSNSAIECILESANFEVSQVLLDEFKEKYAREEIMLGMSNDIIKIIEKNNE
jgi:glycosyltransferase involved in cell wall biosynthesis